MLIEANEEKTLPRIFIDEENGTIEIIGRSISLEVTEFFKPILKYLEKYLDYDLDRIEIKLDLEYFNTASARALINMLKLIKIFSKKHDYNAHVKWLTESDDDEMLDAGKDLECIIGLPFEFVEKNITENDGQL